MTPKQELIELLQQALEMEHAAAIQYFTHAEQITGPNSEALISRLKDTGNDEVAHAAVLRSLLSDYLNASTSINVGGIMPAIQLPDILDSNIATEELAVDIYRKIRAFIDTLPSDFPCLETLDYKVNEILREEQEHIAELSRLR